MPPLLHALFRRLKFKYKGLTPRPTISRIALQVKVEEKVKRQDLTPEKYNGRPCALRDSLASCGVDHIHLVFLELGSDRDLEGTFLELL